ncbi:Lar family restriction alleviation protein [Halomonas sp. WWR20]
MSELKHCPMCGSTSVKYINSGGAHNVECVVCGIGTALYGPHVPRHEVIAVWNRRAEASVDTEPEELPENVVTFTSIRGFRPE